MIRIRAMLPDDIPFAINLTNTEKWGFTHQDFARLLRLDPTGCFVAIGKNSRIGLVTTTSYDHFAWIGNVIVEKSARNRGVGIQLLARAISYVEGKGIKRIGLYSYLQTRPLYKRLGFVETNHFVRYAGIPRKMKLTGAKPLCFKDLDDVARFDKDRFGADRRRLLRMLIQDFPRLSFILKEKDGILGYIMAKAAQSGYEIGPWVCDQNANESMETLLGTELTQMKGKRIEITVSKTNTVVACLLQASGFSPIGEVVEMFRGPLPRRRMRSVLAVAGLEKG
jgi:ribosomal protein S18 acetylase RimI-like enzyme